MDNEILDNYGGFVTSPKDFFGKHRKINQDGLFSEVIFGPTKNFSCACGAYSYKALYENKTCPTCKVKCISNNSRYTTSGKIQLIFPVLKPTKHKLLVKFLGKESKRILDTYLVKTLQSTKNYLGFSKKDLYTLKIFDNLDNTTNFNIIPLRITGGYSLFLILKFLLNKFKLQSVQEIFDSGCFTTILKVLPPALRNVTYDSNSKDYRTPEINKYYTNILQLNKNNNVMLSSLQNDEEDVFDKLEYNIKNNILNQEIFESQLIEYDIISARYQYNVNNIYKSIYKELHGKKGLIRSTILSKNIDFSARSVVACDPSLLPYQVGVSKTILKKLWLPYFLYYLINIKKMEGDYCYNNFVAKNEIQNIEYKKYFDEFIDWFTNDDIGTEEERRIKPLARQGFINRQPTLWRHGCSALDIIPYEGNTIYTSPLMLEGYNQDFDT